MKSRIIEEQQRSSTNPEKHEADEQKDKASAEQKEQKEKEAKAKAEAAERKGDSEQAAVSTPSPPREILTVHLDV